MLWCDLNLLDTSFKDVQLSHQSFHGTFHLMLNLLPKITVIIEG